MQDETAARSLEIALSGRFAHPDPVAVVAGLDAAVATRRPPGALRSVAEILAHIVFWQDVSLRWLQGEVPGDPSPEEAWPDPGDWDVLVSRFRAGLDAARRAASTDLDGVLPGVPDVTRHGHLQVLASHNSWHLGQIVLLRQLLGAWPS